MFRDASRPAKAIFPIFVIDLVAVPFGVVIHRPINWRRNYQVCQVQCRRRSVRKARRRSAPFCDWLAVGRGQDIHDLDWPIALRAGRFPFQSPLRVPCACPFICMCIFRPGGREAPEVS